MFHELLTFEESFEQFTDFNGVFSVFLSKKLFLCTRETMCEPNAMDACIRIAEAMPMLSKQCASRTQWMLAYNC